MKTGPSQLVSQSFTSTPASPLDDDRLAWLALCSTPGLGPRRILDGVRSLHVPSEIFRVSLTELEALNFPAAAAQFIFEG